jgi:hypothetical protein
LVRRDKDSSLDRSCCVASDKDSSFSVRRQTGQVEFRQRKPGEKRA